MAAARRCPHSGGCPAWRAGPGHPRARPPMRPAIPSRTGSDPGHGARPPSGLDAYFERYLFPRYRWGWVSGRIERSVGRRPTASREDLSCLPCGPVHAFAVVDDTGQSVTDCHRMVSRPVPLGNRHRERCGREPGSGQDQLGRIGAGAWRDLSRAGAQAWGWHDRCSDRVVELDAQARAHRHGQSPAGCDHRRRP